MHKKKISKVLCAALTVMMLTNATGFQALAEDADAVQSETQQEVTSTDEAVSEDKADENVSDEKVDAEASVSEDSEQKTREDTTAEETVKQEAVQAEDSFDTLENEAEKMTAKANEDNDGFALNWKAVPEASYYKLTVEADEQDVTDDAVKEEKFVDCKADLKGLTTGKVYTVTVKAFKEDDSELTDAKQSVKAILLSEPSPLTAKEEEKAVTLTWKEVEGAGYVITKGSETRKVEDSRTTSFEWEKLTEGTKYTFSVQAERELDGVTYTSKAATVTVTTKVAKPAKVTGLTAIDGDYSAILNWTAVKNAKTYVVYRYNASRKSWDVAKKDVKTTTYTDKNLKKKTTYRYKVAASNAGGVGAQSDEVSVDVKDTPGKIRTMGYKAVLKSRGPIFTSAKSKTKVKYLAKGTNITTIDYAKGRYEFKLGGKSYWISKDRLSFKTSIYNSKKDYSTQAKTDYINKKGYSSPSKYLIWINQYTQRVMIFEGKKKNWKMIRNCPAATGRTSNMTPKGKFKITYKEKGWFYKTTYEKPIVHFKSQNSFHSRIKNYKGGYADARLGKPISGGCVRLLDEDIVFIYKECPVGTTVISH